MPLSHLAICKHHRGNGGSKFLCLRDRHRDSNSAKTTFVGPILNNLCMLCSGKNPAVGQRENFLTSAASLSNNNRLINQPAKIGKKAEYQWTGLRNGSELFHLSEIQWPCCSYFRGTTCVSPNCKMSATYMWRQMLLFISQEYDGKVAIVMQYVFYDKKSFVLFNGHFFFIKYWCVLIELP